jgi:hypothetical protein
MATGLTRKSSKPASRLFPPRFVVAPARQGDQSCPSVIGQLAERAGDVEAAEARQAEVEQDQIGAELFDAPSAASPS